MLVARLLELAFRNQLEQAGRANTHVGQDTNHEKGASLCDLRNDSLIHASANDYASAALGSVPFKGGSVVKERRANVTPSHAPSCRHLPRKWITDPRLLDRSSRLEVFCASQDGVFFHATQGHLTKAGAAAQRCCLQPEHTETEENPRKFEKASGMLLGV